MPNAVRDPKGRFLPKARPTPVAPLERGPDVVFEPTPLEVWQRVWREANLSTRRHLLEWLQTQTLPGTPADSQEVWP